MKSRYNLQNLFRCMILILSFISCHNCSNKETVKPNVLFIMVDDLRTQLGCYGHHQMITPQIDRLASKGILFSNAYCNVPVCGASRASIMSGMRGTPTRFVNWFVKLEEDAPGIPSMPELFRQNGYRTISLGKVIHHPDDCAGSWSSKPWRPDQEQDVEWTSRGYLNKDNQLLAMSNDNGYASYFEVGDDPSSRYPDEVLADKAIEQLIELSDRKEPFFLAVGFFKPHLPFNAPRKYWDLYQPSKEMLSDHPGRPKNAPLEAFYSLPQLQQAGWPSTAEDSADVYPTKEMRFYEGIPESGPIPDSTAIRLVHGYYATVSYVDDMVGRVLNTLNDLGLEDNTIVVLLGDHGWHLGEHGLWCKHCNFKNVLQAPLLIKVPLMKTGQKTDALTEFVDIYPTLVELCKLDPPEHLEGLSLVPVLKDPGHEIQDAVFLRYHGGNTVMTKQYAFTEWYDQEKNLQGSMLYDHHLDPEENVNLSENPEFETLMHELRGKLFDTWPELK